LRKVRKLSFLGILSVLTVVLFLAGISFMQAQVQITKGKPEKPPGKPEEPEQATWAVRIPTSDLDYTFSGMEETNGYYENNGSTVNVNVKRNQVGGIWGQRYYDFAYSFNFRITNGNLGTPPSEYVRFQIPDNVNWLDLIYPDKDKPCCQFPGDTCEDGGCFNCLPKCMADFLNGTHPQPDYESFYIYVDVFDWDIELMQPGDTYIFGYTSEYLAEHDRYEPGDYLVMVARYRDKCEANPAYHDIELLRNINYQRALYLGNAHNIVIEKLAEPGIECDGVWRIWVLPYDFSGRNLPGYLKVQERYCVRKKWYYSIEAKGIGYWDESEGCFKGGFNFYIDFIKNPVTQ